MVIIAIIALVISLLLPALSRAKETAQRVTCLSNARQYGLLVTLYAVDYNGHLPVYDNRWHGTSHGWTIFGTLTPNIYDILIEYLEGDNYCMRCPNNYDREPYLYVHPRVPLRYNHWTNFTLLYVGGYFQVNAGSGEFHEYNDKTYYGPLTIGDDPDLPLVVDEIKRRPSTPYIRGNHSASGPIDLDANMHPEEAGIVGGNVLLLSGAGRFKDIDDMPSAPGTHYEGPSVVEGQGWNGVYNPNYGQIYF